MAEYYAQIRSPKKRLMSLQIATFFLSRLSNVNPIRIRSKPNHQVRKKRGLVTLPKLASLISFGDSNTDCRGLYMLFIIKKRLKINGSYFAS